ncbi:transcriptional regulator [Dinoroseobacter shibae DFL 12 = DSM 16493]|jgi:LysR family transcriptional activator of nhaA|uniref:Transcriptional regulator n=1 Tax=Dinoroseobacter shibae (strain DSM 16493 / NCIMB 14021 / DFL 12) TaxID=398580 RepID=A8LSC3_DINSH|nr:LysR family transcriptional regulator [Dinoroseobacter shibae]ABV92737.1 transcriptional regulator [Dinoroseobacter shibae DFL 12 = DSM 16493]URF47680.1 LysR family transcriptional regulator [Dinoroseobacter shibae]URF51990.1 LysR family transcriptional regulator [Dinoroseobacter shibae]
MADLNYNHLRYFWAVAHDGNLTRTAARLNLSQSALSVQIRKLEDRLGFALFERRGRALLLTEAGQIALDHADTIFAAGDDLVATLRETGARRQVLRVGAQSTLSRNFQIAFLRPLLGREDVEVVLRSGTVEELLRGLDALNHDVLLTNQPPLQDAGTPYRAQELGAQQVSLIGTPARAQAGEASVEAHLRAHPVILPLQSSLIRAGFDALTAGYDFPIRIAAEVDDMALLRLLAREDLGLAVLPPIVVRDELQSGELVELAPLPALRETFFAVTRPRRFPNPLLADLLAARPLPEADPALR